MVKLRKENNNHSLEGESLLLTSHINFEDLAWESAFYKVMPKKISATNLFLSFWAMQGKGKNSLRKWCIEMSKLTTNTVTTQSLNERINERAVKMGELALAEALNSKKKKEKKKGGLKHGVFNRILIRDSTTQNLPAHLSEFFPGNYNKYGDTAVARIQACYDYTNDKWIHFKVQSYRNNDQGSADCIWEVVEPSDLILQDLGYFTLTWLSQVCENQYIITQWKNRTNLYTIGHEKIDLLKLLQDNKKVDQRVLVGRKEKLEMRLVAQKLPKAKAVKKIKEAKKDRHSKSNHSQEYYELLKYEIYLTNVEKEILTVKEIAKLYGLRWHIEILFKSWKSYANFKSMFQKEKINKHRVLFMIYAMLIQFTYLMLKIYPYIKNSVSKITDRPISILLFIEEMNDSIDRIMKLKNTEELIKNIKMYAKNITYQKHPKRLNTVDKYLYVKNLY